MRWSATRRGRPSRAGAWPLRDGKFWGVVAGSGDPGGAIDRQEAGKLSRQFMQKTPGVVTFPGNENGVARFWVPETLSLDSGGDAELRDFRHTDGDRFPGRHEMDCR